MKCYCVVIAFLAVFVYATYATQAIAFELKPEINVKVSETEIIRPVL